MTDPTRSEPDARSEPRKEYQRRRHARIAELDALERRDNQLANYRLGVFIAGAALGIAAFVTPTVHPAWLVVPALLFAALVIMHDRTARAIERTKGSVRFYEHALARVDDRWAGLGITGSDLAPTEHVYAEDLDLFGAGSLFELLCTAKTRGGEETLARWLCRRAELEEIRMRQDAVSELRAQIDFRENVASTSGGVRSTLRPAVLAAWAQSPPVFTTPVPFAVAVALTVAGIAGVIAWWPLNLGLAPLLLVVICDIIFMRRMQHDVARVTERIEGPSKELSVLAELLRYIEDAEFSCERLKRLQAQLGLDRERASSHIEKLRRIVRALDVQRNQFFAPVGYLLCWPVHCAWAMERWRLAHGKRLPAWLNAVGDLEALLSLAAFSYERPNYTFPEFAGGGITYAGERLRHPLIPERECRPNNVTLNTETRLYIVSGSNMSGKSTYLRVAGINAVLAQSGAPVAADSLRMSPCEVAASIHVLDSLQKGQSHFYAEIRRLKAMMDLAKGDVPLLFLIDEVLHGTNSHDRRIGATAIMRLLLDSGAAGMMTTHDLALTEPDPSIKHLTRNVHFSDSFEDGQLNFDYHLQPGVVSGSNALDLMRSVGLDV